MPYWAVVIVIVALVVVYYMSTSYAREKRRASVGADFAKIPGFHANQVFVDVRGEAAVGIDDRGRRIAVSRKHGQPRLRTYSFGQLTSAEVVQNNAVIARTAKSDATRTSPPEGLLFGSTGAGAGSAGIRLRPGPLTTLAVRVAFDVPGEGSLLVHFHQGKEVSAESVAADKAVSQARLCYGALEVAMRRAVLPTRLPSSATPDRPGDSGASGI